MQTVSTDIMIALLGPPILPDFNSLKNKNPKDSFWVSRMLLYDLLVQIALMIQFIMLGITLLV